MKSLILSAAAVLILAATPSLAAPNRQHSVSHSTSHTTVRHSGGTTHTTRTERTVRTTTSGRSRSWHGSTGHSHSGWHGRSGSSVHVSINIGGLRRNYNAPRRYRFVGDYRQPTGWYAHRWAYGNRLPGGWYGSDYWLGNYVTFGLIAPPDGYQWIREGSDAVLVDVNSGEIIRVEYNVFY
jgi:Ni/Co efflux regulator RcnB